uniref:Uncharacterized protein n=1 Tax=Rhizophora mucronata TaxID=61149 RepID=A0A2P2J444_RHIMU
MPHDKCSLYAQTDPQITFSKANKMLMNKLSFFSPLN